MKIRTGLTSDEGATALGIRYYREFTMVIPYGEQENGECWELSGRVTPETALEEYLEAMKEVL